MWMFLLCRPWGMSWLTSSPSTIEEMSRIPAPALRTFPLRKILYSPISSSRLGQTDTGGFPSRLSLPSMTISWKGRRRRRGTRVRVWAGWSRRLQRSALRPTRRPRTVRPCSRSGLDEDIPAAVAGDAEGQLAGPAQGLADGAMPPGRGDQQQEAAAAGPQQLAPGGAGPPRRLVPLVERPVADPEAQRPLQLPAL